MIQAASNAMTIDVEDYFQVSAFEKLVSKDRWDSMELRVGRNTERLLDLFAEKNIKATFFILGWVANKLPMLIKKIAEQGHEVASHGMHHQRVTDLSCGQFKVDLSESKKMLEDLTGGHVLGYRAPSFSFNNDNPWVYETLGEVGYRYSSSVYPVVHDHYGIPNAPRHRYDGGFGVEEIPLSTLPIMKKNIPISGGGYFRLYPYRLTRWAINRMLAGEKIPYIFYLHPWEIDPEQPTMPGISLKTRFRHYINLSLTERKLTKLLDDYQWDSVASVFKIGER